VKRHVDFAKVETRCHELDARVYRCRSSAQAIEPVHVREVEVLHRVHATSARNCGQELAEPGGDVEVCIGADVLEINALRVLEHVYHDLAEHYLFCERHGGLPTNGSTRCF
jgi:hypothetical protein